MPKLPNRNRKLIQQVCVIPYRRPHGGEATLEFCLITSLLKKRWIFPKGIIEPGETPAQAALKEVWEEAGLRGELVGEPLGKFDDQKWGCDLEVQVLLMEVSETADVWPELPQRQRQWATASVALEQLKRSELKACLRAACERLQTPSPHQAAPTPRPVDNAPSNSDVVT